MAEEHGEHGKKKLDFKKRKWWIFGAGGVGLLLLLALKRNSSSSANTAQTTAQNQGIDPATGYLYGSAADLAALSGSTEGVYSGGSGTTGTSGTGSTSTTNNYYNYYGSGSSGSSSGGGTTAGGGTVSRSGGSPPKGAGGAVAKASSAAEHYTVQPNDSLWKISEKFYGTGQKDMTIYQANRSVIGSNPDMIHPGQKLVIPGK